MATLKTTKNKPKTSNHNHHHSTGPTMAELIALEQKHKENNNSDTVVQHNHHNKKAVSKTLPFELMLAKHNSRRSTKPGPLAAYSLVQAARDCSHKNNLSIKSFK